MQTRLLFVRSLLGFTVPAAMSSTAAVDPLWSVRAMCALALDKHRKAGKPLAIRKMAPAAIAAKGIKVPDRRTAKATRNRSQEMSIGLEAHGLARTVAPGQATQRTLIWVKRPTWRCRLKIDLGQGRSDIQVQQTRPMSDWPYLRGMSSTQLSERAAEYAALAEHAQTPAMREICAQLAARYAKAASKRRAEEKLPAKHQETADGTGSNTAVERDRMAVLCAAGGRADRLLRAK